MYLGWYRAVTGPTRHFLAEHQPISNSDQLVLF